MKNVFINKQSSYLCYDGAAGIVYFKFTIFCYDGVQNEII